jgi:acetyl esterase/lipase
MRGFFVSLLLVATLALSASAQKTLSLEGVDETVRLWDNSSAKYSNCEIRDEKWRNEKKNIIFQISSCELYILKAAEGKNTGVAIAMFPGGSYIREVFSVSIAKWYASQGITVAMVKYRLPNYGHSEASLEDAMGAVRYLRTRTDLGIDPAKVGVWGDSAGGHLATWVSNAMPVGEKPAFTIAHYGWVDAENSNTPATQKGLINILGKGYTLQDTRDISTYLMVNKQTPPTLLLLCDDDSVVSPDGAARYYEALIRYGVKASMHIFPFGGHSLRKHTAEYEPLVLDWLGLTKK